MATRVHDCVGAFIVKDGEVLLGLRSDDCDWLAGAWDVFGGHIEPGETADDALRRELDKELGIAPTRMRYLDAIRGDAPQPWHLRLYVIEAWDGTPENRQEHSALSWSTLDQAQERLAAAHPDFPRLLAQALGGDGALS
ncbi:NUDIX hydrolase [Lysobacter sp. GCM10012299]|uniref:NUDIX hydrolase n=1 Tax=Lysobacter sp. GCM10012299 TaxID=3317333 RepID=UPI00360EBCB9